jgi:pimeloyl-ACP methyl ester carboxylesterase
MPFVASDDHVRIYYQQRGSGPAVLLSHGFRASSVIWRAQMDALSDRYHVIAWDMRGHGRSDSPSDAALYSHQASVADMVAIMRDCGVDRAAIGGLSLGGFISLAFYLAHPEKTTALLLFDTGPAKREAQRAQVATPGSQPSGWEHARRGMLERSDHEIIASLSSIRVPVLVLCGALDERFLTATDYLAATISGAEKVILQGAGHVSNLDQPHAFNAAVRSFLDRVIA